jgi:TPR repeat protein
VERDFDSAFSYYRKAAAQNHVPAQFNLGMCYSLGHGVAKDEVKAVEWIKKAANQNLDEAKLSLAMIYLQGGKAVHNEKNGVIWLRKCQNLLPAQFVLGECYQMGRGVAKNVPAGTKLIRKAANGGFVPAMTAMGTICLKGIGVKADKAAAKSWFQKAARQGDANAQAVLRNWK